MAKASHTVRHLLLAQMLVELRNEAGMTQTDVAKALRRHQSLVANIESGQRRVDVIELLDLARVLGFSASELVARLASSPVEP